MLCLSLATVVVQRLLPGSGRLPGLPGELQRIYGVHASSTVVAGVAITHTKGDSAIDTSTITVDFEGTSSAETRWALDESSVPPWISVSPTSGFVPAGVDEGALFTVSASSAGVAEQEDPYTASVNLTFASAAVGEVSAKVPILLIVAPATSARNSMWGEARQRTDSIYDCVRPTTVPPPIELEVGLEQSVFFSACDSEGMRVAHMVPSEGLRVAHALSHPNEVEGLYGPKAFKVVLRGQSSGFEYEMKHEYASTGRYRATVLAPLVGEYELFLLLDGTEVDVRSVVANCQPPLVALPDHSCGCDAGLEPGYQDDRSLLEPGALRACQPCSFGFHKALPGNGECLAQQWPIVVSTIGGGLALVIIIALIIVARRVHVHHMLAMEAVEREIAEKQRRICRAMTGVTTLDFPLSVMPLSKLREQGRLVPYEEARDAGALRCCDTVESAVAFAAGRPLIFVSHQWLSLLHPDPEAQHYPIIIRAAEALCARQGLNPDSLHIWLDYHSIPQENETTKRLAIGSIALYAACSHYFLVCAPAALHQDSVPPCRVDADTYLQRGWCRLEQWAFMAINGADDMYIFDAALAPLSSRRRWIEESVNVFQGEFTHDSDKALLVDVVLGLYGLAVVAALDPSVASSKVVSRGKRSHASQQASSRQLVELIAERRDFIFPSEHFGDLVVRLEAELDRGARECSTASETYRAARSARQTLHSSCGLSVRKFSV